MPAMLQELSPELIAGGVLLLAVLIGLVAHAIFWRAVRLVAGRTTTVFDDSLHRHCRRPSTILFAALAIHLALPLLPVQRVAGTFAVAATILTILLILSVAWLLIRLGSVLQDVLLERFRLDVADNLEARRIHTQVGIIKKIISFVVTIVSLGAVLMLFKGVRQVGAGLLASAGLAGVIIGFAAQKTLGNLVAGIQLAFTQPICIDDVVIVENEWGWIEEITLTYVVVKIWDLRRLVLPISYFIEKPFQNWTRVSADILGTIYLYTDYRVPVAELRKELTRIVSGSDLWDGEVAAVQVTDCKQSTVEVRALISAADSGKAWDLRCLVREQLLAFLQERYPESLPRVRAEVGGEVHPPSPPARRVSTPA